MHRPTRIRSIRRTLPRFVENLESRLLLSTTLTPAQIRQAYGISQLSATGAGQTIAIIDAYNDTHIASDLNAFDQQYSVNGSSTLYSQYGAASSFLTVDTLGTRTPSDAGWAMEESLDVEWAHAIAPGAKIVVVQAQSDSLTNLLAAVNYAREISTVSVISMSWGSSEFNGETSYDADFTTPAGHIGITFVASAGDDGAGASWPAISDNVLAVGGTTLTLASNGNYASESAWSDSGGGSSLYETTPTYQSSVNATSHRTDPDVAYDANPNSGYYVYDSNYDGQSGWWSVGGTSAGAPQWAGLVALADQIRGTSLTGAQTLTTLYQLPASDFHDITTGSNGNAAKTGYDLVTGRGSPVANLLVPALAATTVPASTVITTVPQTPTTTKSNSNSHGRRFLQIENFLSPLPPIAFLSTDLTTLTTPMFPADASFITAPLTLAPTTSLVLPTTPLTEARIADPLLPPSTDDVLPSTDPDPTPQDFPTPDDSPAPAPFAQLPEDPTPELAYLFREDFTA